jgi:hypothetical protein
MQNAWRTRNAQQDGYAARHTPSFAKGGRPPNVLETVCGDCCRPSIVLAASLDALARWYCEPHTNKAPRSDGAEKELARSRNAGLLFEPEVIAARHEAFEAARKRSPGAPKESAKSSLDEL